MTAEGVADALARLDWHEMGAQLDEEGYALIPNLFSPQAALALAQLATSSAGLRPIRLENLDLGQGEMHVLHDPLAPVLTTLRSALYPPLATIADRWNERQGLDVRYPRSFDASALVRPQPGQEPSPPHLTRLLEDDFVALHLCAGAGAGGECALPLRLVALLSRPGEDFDGGNLILTEQRPRMQSRPAVIPLQFGDAAVICANQRPVQGRSGIYRVTVRHAISRVLRGSRIGLELSFQAYAPPHR
ncbi:2OG-Fe(II) oxygenase [Variovorax dokdonensis]